MGDLGQQDGYPVGVSNADFAGGELIDCPFCEKRIEVGPECPECGHDLTVDDIEGAR